jgi:hypothetical protein
MKPLAIALPLILSALCTAQEGIKSASLLEPLGRTASRLEAGQFRVAEAFGLAFGETSTPAGLEMKRCGNQTASIEVESHPTLRSVVMKLMEGNSRSTVRLSGSGVVNVSLMDSAVNLLDTKIVSLDVPFTSRSPMATVQFLVSAPEVRAAAAALGLTYKGGELGFSTITKAGSPATVDSPILLRDVDLREGLNQIAKRLDRGVWIYAEDICAERHTFTVSFPVR